MKQGFRTPNGMKVGLDMNYCMRYLKSDDDVIAWSVSIEVFSYLSAFLSLIGAIVLMFSEVTTLGAGLTVLGLYLLGFVISQSARLMFLFRLPYKLGFAFYERLTRLFIPHLALIVVIYLILLVYLVARFVGLLLVMFVIGVRGRRYHSRYGVYFGDTEITAIKLLNIYSNKKIDVNKWIAK